MEKLMIVPRLDNLAFNVAFEEILSNLALCPDHCLEEKKLRTITFSSALSLSPLFTSQNLINFVRKRLDYFLIGTMNDEIRKKLVETFYGHFSKTMYDNNVDPWVFMDCVLDDTFQELKTRVSLLHSEPDLKLIPTIAKRSGQLKKLKLDFSYSKCWIEVEKVSQMIISLSSLQNLSSLNLYGMLPSHKSVLKFIGNSCPLLTHLSISGFRLSPKDILSIILGEFADHLFPPNCETKLWVEDIHLEHLKAPVEVLTPICFTLRHLQLGDSDWDVDSDDCWTVVSFLLHHLPLLEKMDGRSTTYGASYLNGTWGMKDMAKGGQDAKPESSSKIVNDLAELFGVQATNEMHIEMENVFKRGENKIEKQNEKFKKACKNFLATRSTNAPEVDIENIALNYPEFKGYLSLSTLDFVYCTPLILLVIPKFCPNLKEVVFYEKMTKKLGRGRNFEVKCSSDKVRDHLKEWPKLESITFMKMSPEYVKVILEAFAPSLKRVTFNCCKNINLLDLLPCSQLESLRILKSSSLTDIKVKSDGRLSPKAILPHLKFFESEICLNLWTLWLEAKSELTHVVLNCCNNDTQASIHLNWNNIPKMWPKIEALHIQRCDGLPMSSVSSIVPQLSKLKDLSLPEKIVENDPELAIKTWEDLNYRSAPVCFSFTEGRGKRCSLLWGVDEVSTDSDDDEDESSEDDDMEEDNTSEESDESSMDIF